MLNGESQNKAHLIVSSSYPSLGWYKLISGSTLIIVWLSALKNETPYEYLFWNFQSFIVCQYIYNCFSLITINIYYTVVLDL